MSSLFLNTLAGQKTDRPPFWFMRQAGRYLPEYRALRKKADGFLNLCLNSSLASQVTLQPMSRFEPDAAILFSDILIVPYGLGMAVDFVEGRGPVLDAISDSSDIKRLNSEQYKTRIEATYETVRLCRDQLSLDKALIGFAGSPWTVATYMIEGGASKNYAKVKSWAYRDDQSFNTLIKIVTRATIDHLSAQIDHGADAVKLFDSWAGVLSPSQFEKWVIKPTREIVDSINLKYPTIKIIGFPKGAGHQYIDYVNKTGVDAVAIDTSVNPGWAAKMLDKKVVIQGNMDPISLLVGGESMLNQACSIISNMKERPHVFNLGHGVLPETPPENVEALAKYLRNLGEG
ncbi:MAG: uroporphyrinogen decarboxylase [Pseudomonadota bacterium]|jgi:uroporphyrinogen decarboxylase|nr:uroporphyrinogen decarboxylase [Pseudomonadota bacterium]MEC7661730.1 uroporphyrinogen decarboxylase [Pseudomonadota bacterium]MEC8751424.1 uroporphyrinogen decarboxylase [Pseudomonadota bacterium]|tara:strand:- start:507 stop:1541 length:1035 start_codon:yes stop_codon:yes gene_type:complete